MSKNHADYAIVLVTFNPNQNTLNYIKSLAKSAHFIYIIDNSTHAINFSEIELFTNVILKINKRNSGLAVALNYGVITAGSANYTNIFLFDQDTRVENSYFDSMLKFKEGLKSENCIIYAPNFIDINSGTYATFVKLKKWTWQNISCTQLNNAHPTFVNFAITSGTLLDYTKFIQVGKFRDDFFIDHIDSEYCLRASKNKFKIAINCCICIYHQIGQRTVHNLFGLTIKPNHHNADRRYYIARNGMRTIIFHYRLFPSITFLNIARIVHELLSVLIYENNKIQKIKAIVLGIVDGLVGKMDRTLKF